MVPVAATSALATASSLRIWMNSMRPESQAGWSVWWQGWRIARAGQWRRVGGGFQPDMKSAGVGVGLIAGIVFVIWMGTGFFIVQEGQQAVITQFGSTRAPWVRVSTGACLTPIERHELVFVTQIRSADVGRDTVIKSTGLRESAMLTEDENIVEIKFAVQYRLSDARAWLFESKNPSDAVVQAAETAVREVVGKMRMDTALAEERDQIAPRVRTLMQTILDRYKVGVEVVGINLQQGGCARQSRFRHRSMMF